MAKKMVINLSKGEIINLEKEDDSIKLEEINVGMGWLMASKSKGKPRKQTVTKTHPAGGFLNKIRSLFGMCVPEVTETVEVTVTPPKSDYEYDLDESCYVKGLGRGHNGLVYFGDTDGVPGIHHGGDNLVGGTGKKDDETINIKLNRLPETVSEIFIFMNIYRASERNQCFAGLTTAYGRIYNVKTHEELCRYDLTDLKADDTALILGKLYKENGNWMFQAIGETTKADHPLEMREKLCKR